MTEESGDSIGSLSVDIVADLTPLESARNTAASILEALVKTPYVIKINSSELADARDAVQQVRDALLQVQKSAAEPVSKTTRTLRFDVDTAKIRSDIESALKDPFKINLEIANMEAIRKELGTLSVTVTHAGGAHGPAMSAGPGPGQQQAPRQAPATIRRDIEDNPALAKAITALHDSLDTHLQAAGKQGLGAPTNDPVEKFGHLVDRFGMHLTDFVQVDEAGRTKGGAFSKAGVAAMGIDAKNYTALNAAAKDFQKLAGTTLLFSHLRDHDTGQEWRGGGGQPMPTAQVHHQATVMAEATAKAVRELLPKSAADAPAAAPERLIDRLQAAIASRGPMASTRYADARPLQNDLFDSLKQVVEINRGLERSSKMRTQRGTRTTRTAGSELFGQGGATDEEAESNRPVAEREANPARRLVGRVTGTAPNGKAIDLTQLAQIAAAGGFQRFGRETGGKKRLVELSAEHLETNPFTGELAPFQKRSASGRVTGKLRAMIGGREIEKVNPMDLVLEAAEKLFGPEGRQVAEQSTVKQKMSQFLAAGARVPFPGNGVEYRLSGQTGRDTMYGSGLGRTGSGFSEASVIAAKREALAQNVMGARRSMDENYGAMVRQAMVAHSTVNQERIQTGLRNDPQRREDAEQVARIRKGIGDKTLPDPENMLAKIMAELPNAVATGPGGDRAGIRAVREIWHGMVGEISHALGLGIDTTGPSKRVDAKLSQAGLGYLSDVRRAAYGEIGTRDLYANQDINRMRQPGGNDRLGSPMRANGKDVLLPTAPMTPAQRRARDARELASSLQRGELSSPLKIESMSAPPLGYRVPPLLMLEQGLSTPYQSRPGGSPLGYSVPGLNMLKGKSSRFEHVEPNIGATVARLRKQAYEELTSTRQAFSFIDQITGSTHEELEPEPVEGGYGQVGGRPRKVYGGRKIREVPHRYEPRFVRHVSDTPTGDRAEVLAALHPEALERRENALRAQMQAATAGGAAVDVADIQRQLENVINVRKSPSVQEEIRSLYDKAAGAGVGRAVRRKGAAGATSQQVREKFLENLGEFAPGTAITNERPIVPYARGVPIPPSASTASPMTDAGFAGEVFGGGGGGAGAGGRGPGGPVGGRSVIDVRIIAPLPVPVSVSGGGGSGQVSQSGIGGVGTASSRAMYPSSAVTPGVPGPAEQKAKAAAKAAEEGNRLGRIQMFPSQKTATLPESMQIRMKPRVVISPEQRAAEKAAALATTAGGPGRRRTPVSNAELQRMGFLTDEGTVPARLTTRLDPDVAGARASVQLARGTLPSRSIGTSFVQLSENLFGGRRGPLERLATLQNRASDLEGLATRQIGLDAARTAGGADALKARAAARAPGADAATIQAAVQLRGRFLDLSKAAHDNRNELVKATDDVDHLSKSVVGATDVVRNLAAGALGGVVGGLAAGGVSAVAGVVTSTVSRVLGPVAERMSGYQATTARVVDSLSDATRARGGDAAGAVASAGASAGFSKGAYDLLSPALTGLARIEAGNKAIVEQVDMTRASQNLARGGGGGLLGFTNNQGGIPGLTQATGGLLGSSINATPSTAEAVFGGMPNGYGVQGNGPVESFFKLLDVFAGPTNSKAGAPAPNSPLVAEMAQDVQIFNDQVMKGGSGLKLMTGATQAQTDAYVKSLKSIKAGDAAVNLAQANHMAVVDAQGNVPDDAAKRSLEAYNLGATVQDPALVLEGMKRQIGATVNAIKRDLQTQLGANLGGEAIGRLAQPLAPSGRGLLGAGAPASVTAAFAAAEPGLAAQRATLNARTDTGVSILEQQYHVPPSLLTDLKAVGVQINALQNDEANRTAANFWTDYSQEVKVATRNVSDLVGLVKGVGGSENVTGVGSVGASRVGALQNQNLTLGRESQLIGFAQSQRQINFAVATAGFQTQGTTPEEIAANRDQARFEASFAQKQLNISKQVGANNYEITTTLNARSLQDAKFALEKLPRDLDLQVHIKIDEDKLALLNETRAGILADVGAYQQAGAKLISAMSQTVTELETQAGGFFKNLTQDVISAFTDAFGNNPFGSNAPATPNQREDRTPALPATPNQREDRNKDTGGPGGVTPMGGGDVVIQILGGTFTDEQSRRGLIRDVQTAVEQGLDRKASLIGLRSPR